MKSGERHGKAKNIKVFKCFLKKTLKTLWKSGEHLGKVKNINVF